METPSDALIDALTIVHLATETVASAKTQELLQKVAAPPAPAARPFHGWSRERMTTRLGVLRQEIARATAVFERGSRRKVGFRYASELGKQARRLRFLGTARQEIMALERMVGA